LYWIAPILGALAAAGANRLLEVRTNPEPAN
jgi:hypothetical protein